MNLCFKTENGFDFTPISNIFIDEYIKGVNPSFVIVYLISLRYFYSLEDINTKMIAEIAGLLESDVIKAYEYWSEKNVIGFEKSEDDFITIEFYDLKEQLIKKEAEKQAALALENEMQAQKVKKNYEDRASYSNDEIKVILEKNPEINFIVSLAEKSFGKLLTANERNILVSLYDWLQLPTEVIATLITYCSENNKNIRYLEKVAIDWAEKGIDTEEKAAECLSMYSNEYKDIMLAFGIRNREPIEEEQNLMKKWLKVFKMPIEVIREACARTITATGKPQFNYADKILKNWFEKNVQTLEDIKRVDEEFNKNRRNISPNYTNTSAPKVNTANKSRFVNYEQRSVDPNKMRELERKILEKDLKKIGGK